MPKLSPELVRKPIADQIKTTIIFAQSVSMALLVFWSWLCVPLMADTGGEQGVLKDAYLGPFRRFQIAEAKTTGVVFAHAAELLDDETPWVAFGLQDRPPALQVTLHGLPPRR